MRQAVVLGLAMAGMCCLLTISGCGSEDPHEEKMSEIFSKWDDAIVKYTTLKNAYAKLVEDRKDKEIKKSDKHMKAVEDAIKALAGLNTPISRVQVDAEGLAKLKEEEKKELLGKLQGDLDSYINRMEKIEIQLSVMVAESKSKFQKEEVYEDLRKRIEEAEESIAATTRKL